MKILYLSDNYGKHNAGTKHSIYREVQRRGHKIKFQSVHSAGSGKVNGPRLLADIRKGGFDWVWVAHSWVEYVSCTLADIHDAGARVLGFGFSDPYGWKPSKLDQYDAYSTNHFGVYREVKEMGTIPVTVFATAGDSHFHQDLGLPRTTDILFVGLGRHLRFTPRDYRLTMMREVYRQFPDCTIEVFGNGWDDVPNKGEIRGRGFLEALNRAKVSLDLQQRLDAPLAHRLFEAMMCGTPTIARARPEMDDIFGKWPGVWTYEGTEDLCERIREALARPDWADWSKQVREYTLAHHDISNRMDDLEAWLKTL